MPPKFDMQAARKHADTGDLMKTTKWLYAALDEIERLQKVVSDPVESFGTPELAAWAEGLQKILADFPEEEERGQIPFVMTMGCHLEKFAKSWNSLAMAEQAKRIAELEAALVEERSKVLYFAHAGDGMYDMDVLEEADHHKTRHSQEADEQLHQEGKL